MQRLRWSFPRTVLSDTRRGSTPTCALSSSRWLPTQARSPTLSHRAVGAAPLVTHTAPRLTRKEPDSPEPAASYSDPPRGPSQPPSPACQVLRRPTPFTGSLPGQAVGPHWTSVLQDIGVGPHTLQACPDPAHLPPWPRPRGARPPLTFGSGPADGRVCLRTGWWLPLLGGHKHPLTCGHRGRAWVQMKCGEARRVRCRGTGVGSEKGRGKAACSHLRLWKVPSA